MTTVGPQNDLAFIGGIDLGGSKIEARLFDSTAAQTLALQRIATPTHHYDALLDVLVEQIHWLDAAGGGEVPVGIAVPGMVDPQTSAVFAANIPTDGRRIDADLHARLNRRFVVINDGMAFALSEANGGAGHGASVVMGLILGTGVGGGICEHGRLPPGRAGLAVEIGHVALPASIVARYQLPLLSCGCGRLGCMETYLSGTGLSNLAERMLGERLSAQELVARQHQQVLDIWADLAGECLMTVQLTLAPDCIVLGGGVSNLPNVATHLSDAMQRHKFGNMRLPQIVTARHGDSSGARGAALMAVAA